MAPLMLAEMHLSRLFEFFLGICQGASFDPHSPRGKAVLHFMLGASCQGGAFIYVRLIVGLMQLLAALWALAEVRLSIDTSL